LRPGIERVSRRARQLISGRSGQAGGDLERAL
jgi:hypothetical protein